MEPGLRAIVAAPSDAPARFHQSPSPTKAFVQPGTDKPLGAVCIKRRSFATTPAGGGVDSEPPLRAETKVPAATNETATRYTTVMSTVATAFGSSTLLQTTR